MERSVLHLSHCGKIHDLSEIKSLHLDGLSFVKVSSAIEAVTLFLARVSAFYLLSVCLA